MAARRRGPGRRTGRLGERFEERGMGRRHTELIGQVGLDQGTRPPVGDAGGDGRQV